MDILLGLSPSFTIFSWRYNPTISTKGKERGKERKPYPNIPLLTRICKPHRDPTSRLVPPPHHPPMQPLDDLFGRCTRFQSNSCVSVDEIRVGGGHRHSPNKRNNPRRITQFRLEEPRALDMIRRNEGRQRGLVDTQRKPSKINININK